MRKAELLDEIETLAAKPKLDAVDMQNLSGRLNELKANKDEEAEAQDILPAIKRYKAEHTQANLQRLCVEIGELCTAVYASTRSEEERVIYRNMLTKLQKEPSY